MEFGFIIEGAKSKKPTAADVDAAPRQQPMRAGLSPATRRSPSTDQKKARTQQAHNRRTAGASDPQVDPHHSVANPAQGRQSRLTDNPGADRIMSTPFIRTASDLTWSDIQYQEEHGHLPDNGSTMDEMAEYYGDADPEDVRAIETEVALRHLHEENERLREQLGDREAVKGDPHGKTKESSTMSTAHTEAQLLAALAYANPDEQVRLVAEIDALRRATKREAAMHTDAMWAEEIVADTLTPVLAHARHTAATDWLGEAIEAPLDVEHVGLRMRAAANTWYNTTSVEVRQDPEEFVHQMRGMAKHHASSLPAQWNDAFECFVAQATHLRRTEFPESHRIAAQMMTAGPLSDSGPNPQSGYGESSLPGEIKPADARETQDNFAPEVAPENAWITEEDESSDRMPVVQENKGGPSADSNQTGTASLHKSATTCQDCGNEIKQAEDPNGYGREWAREDGDGDWTGQDFQCGLSEDGKHHPGTTASLHHAARPPCANCGHEIGEDYQTCPNCLHTDPNIKARHNLEVGPWGKKATTAAGESSEDARGRVPTEVLDLDDPDEDPMWPWEQDANTPGSDAANVSSVPTPGKAGYPQPRSSKLAWTIDQVRDVLNNGIYTDAGKIKKVDGMLLDAFTASAIAQVYENLNPENQARFASLPLEEAARTAFSLSGTPATAVAQNAFRTRVAANLHKQADGNTCATCGASIERDPEGEANRTWHHNDGAKHDHEATPAGDTTASRHPFVAAEAEEKQCDYTEGHRRCVYRKGHSSEFAHRLEYEGAKTAASCVCAHNTDGSVTKMLCPQHADDDPCRTMAAVTGDRRKGSIVKGVCTNCGWSSKTTAGAVTAADAIPEGCIGCIVMGGTPIVIKAGCPVHDTEAKTAAKSRNCINGNHSDCGHNCGCTCHNKRNQYSGACAAGDHEACRMEGCPCPHHSKKASSHISVKVQGVSLTNVGIDPETQNGVGTDPSGQRVQFALSDSDRAQLKSVLLSDLAANFSGVDVDEDEIIKGASATAGVSEIQQAIREHAEHAEGTIKPGDRIGDATITDVGTHTVQYSTDDGYSGSMQIPWLTTEKDESGTWQQRVLPAGERAGVEAKTAADKPKVNGDRCSNCGSTNLCTWTNDRTTICEDCGTNHRISAGDPFFYGNGKGTKMPKRDNIASKADGFSPEFIASVEAQWGRTAADEHIPGANNIMAPRCTTCGEPIRWESDAPDAKVIFHDHGSPTV